MTTAYQRAAFPVGKPPVSDYLPRTARLTGATPAPFMLIAPAAADDRSITRPPTYGPRSLMVTTTDWPLRWLVTRTLVPNGSVLWAAVMAFGLKVPPEASLCGCQ